MKPTSPESQTTMGDTSAHVGQYRYPIWGGVITAGGGVGQVTALTTYLLSAQSVDPRHTRNTWRQTKKKEHTWISKDSWERNMDECVPVRASQREMSDQSEAIIKRWILCHCFRIFRVSWYLFKRHWPMQKGKGVNRLEKWEMRTEVWGNRDEDLGLRTLGWRMGIRGDEWGVRG